MKKLRIKLTSIVNIELISIKFGPLIFLDHAEDMHLTTQDGIPIPNKPNAFVL